MGWSFRTGIHKFTLFEVYALRVNVFILYSLLLYVVCCMSYVVCVSVSVYCTYGS